MISVTYGQQINTSLLQLLSSMLRRVQPNVGYCTFLKRIQCFNKFSLLRLNILIFNAKLQYRYVETKPSKLILLHPGSYTSSHFNSSWPH